MDTNLPYSLVGQDSRLSPGRPGFESLWGNIFCFLFCVFCFGGFCFVVWLGVGCVVLFCGFVLVLVVWFCVVLFWCWLCGFVLVLVVWFCFVVCFGVAVGSPPPPPPPPPQTAAAPTWARLRSRASPRGRRERRPSHPKRRASGGGLSHAAPGGRRAGCSHRSRLSACC